MAEIIEVMIRQDGASWGAWSPQCPGLAVVAPTPEALRVAVPEAVAFYYGGTEKGRAQLIYNVEQELSGVIVRVRQDERVDQRRILAERLAVALVQSDQVQEFRAGTANRLGDVVYVCALPEDAVGWVKRQLEDQDALHVVLSVTDDFIWSTFFGSGPARSTDPRTFTLAELGYDETTPLAEVLRRDLIGQAPASGLLPASSSRHPIRVDLAAVS